MDKLPSLAPAGQVPSYAQFARYFERPWLDHLSTWLFQVTGPTENQANYGREFSRIGGMAGLMLMLDRPQTEKEPLLRGFIQFGIDLYGLAKAGRVWSSDGGHWNGRKWPILFAAIMLNNDDMLEVVGSKIFSEDRQTYYGTGSAGQEALWQIVTHTGSHPPYEEKPQSQWTKNDKRQESYRSVVSGSWPATALGVQLMAAKAAWNHDVYFDYVDRWMNPKDPYASKRDVPRPKNEGKSQDAFVDAMWAAYRNKAPDQPGAKDPPTKWVWDAGGKTGKYVPNPKP